MEETLPQTFITYAANTLGATSSGLSGNMIAEYCSAYGTDFNVEIPFPSYPFPTDINNKRTALRKNLSAFNSQQQYKIIKELCELELAGRNESH